MASKRFDEGTQERDMFQDYWRLCQMFWIVEDKEEYWSQFYDAINNFCKKYNNDEFARRISMAFYDTKESEYKRNLENQE